MDKGRAVALFWPIIVSTIVTDGGSSTERLPNDVIFDNSLRRIPTPAAGHLGLFVQ